MITENKITVIDEINRLKDHMRDEAIQALDNPGQWDSVFLYPDYVRDDTVEFLHRWLIKLRDTEYAAIIKCRTQRHAHWDNLELFTKKLPEQKALRTAQRAFKKMWNIIRKEFDAQTATDRKTLKARGGNPGETDSVS